MPQETAPTAWEQRTAANLGALAPRPRQAFLLIAVEGFSNEQAAEILDATEEEFAELLAQASAEISRQVATDILIIEDEPLIAMDIEQMVESLGHRVVGTARTHAEAIAHVQELARQDGPCRHPACRRQFGHRRRERNPVRRPCR